MKRCNSRHLDWRCDLEQGHEGEHKRSVWRASKLCYEWVTWLLAALALLACGTPDPAPPDACEPFVVYASPAAKRCLVVTAPEGATVRVEGDTSAGTSAVVIGERESYELLACDPTIAHATSERCEP